MEQENTLGLGMKLNLDFEWICRIKLYMFTIDTVGGEHAKVNLQFSASILSIWNIMYSLKARLCYHYGTWRNDGIFLALELLTRIIQWNDISASKNLWVLLLISVLMLMLMLIFSNKDEENEFFVSFVVLVFS